MLSAINVMLILIGLIGLANWIISLIGFSFCIAGPKRSRTYATYDIDRGSASGPGWLVVWDYHGHDERLQPAWNAISLMADFRHHDPVFGFFSFPHSCIGRVQSVASTW